MARPKTVLQSEFPYNLSARCNNRDWFDIPLERAWQIFCEELYMAVVIHGLKVHSFILMANHFHLVASTPEANVSSVMKRFMEMTSRRTSQESKRMNRVWGTRYYKSVLPSQNAFLNVYKYNYFNPVKAGVTKRCEDYPFSTLSGLLGKTPLLVPVVEDQTLFASVDETLRWLNTRPPQEKLIAIQSALKKSEFRHVKCSSERKQLMADDELI